MILVEKEKMIILSSTGPERLSINEDYRRKLKDVPVKVN